MELIHRFFLAFDRQDWVRMRDCLCDEIDVDYSDLRGEPARRETADEYVAKRERALSGLRTIHVGSNFVVADDSCACVCLVMRTAADGRTFDTAADYTFGLREEKIAAITQKVIWNRGDPGVHGALTPG